MRTKINNYIKNGWSFFEDIIPDSELPNYEELLINEHTPILESDQIRSIYGFHHQDQFIQWLKKQLFIKNELKQGSYAVAPKLASALGTVPLCTLLPKDQSKGSHGTLWQQS